MDENNFEQQQKDITSILRDGMSEIVTVEGPDGQPVHEIRIRQKSAFWKTHNINHHAFGLAAEAFESLAALGLDAKYHMMPSKAKVIEEQVLTYVNDVLKSSIDAKSSESMRDGKNTQTSLLDKYLRNRQERKIDFGGELKKAGLAGIFGDKEAERASD